MHPYALLDQAWLLLRMVKVSHILLILAAKILQILHGRYGFILFNLFANYGSISG